MSKPLDPEPYWDMFDDSSKPFDHDVHGLCSVCVWKPRPEYEQDRSRYKSEFDALDDLIDWRPEY